MKNLFVLFSIILISNISHSSVWVSTQEWTPEWEKQYSQWVQQNWNIHFFDKALLSNGQKNPYYGLKVDCADTVYSMRIIFAFEHSLPVEFNDPTTTGKRLTNKMSRWDQLAPKDRIRQFLLFIYGITSTSSLPDDTFSPQLNSRYIKAGSLLLTVHENHHSWTIQNIYSTGVPHLIYSSRVNAASSLTLLERSTWPNPAWVFQGNQTSTSHAGLRYWRPSDTINLPEWKVPGYSIEQYQIPIAKWNTVIQQKLASEQEQTEQKINRYLQSICAGINERISSVNESLIYRKKINNRCMNQTEFDDLSTPNRDRRIFDDILSLREIYQELTNKNELNQISESLNKQLSKLFPLIQETNYNEINQISEKAVDENSLCLTRLNSSQMIDLAQFYIRQSKNLISSNPNEDFDYRWGYKSGSSLHAGQCPRW